MTMFLSLLALWSSHAPMGAEPGSRVFRAGAFAMDTTPLRFPISMNGGMADRQALYAYDRLHARCLVLDDGATKLGFVVCDACMVTQDVFDDAKERIAKKVGIPPSHMMMSATHTHTAPTLGGTFQSEPDVEYKKFLAERIAAGVEKAHSQLRPALIGWGKASEPGQVFNRRWRLKPDAVARDPFGRTTDRARMNPGFGNKEITEPAGPTDPDVWVLAARTLEGQPIALFANYSLHYVGRGIPPNALSADYFGQFAEFVGAKLGAATVTPAFVGALSNGASGDINNINFAAAAPPQTALLDIREVANILADAAVKAYREIKFKESAPLSARLIELPLAVRKPDAKELARAKELLEAAAKAKRKVLQSMDEIYARETVLLNEYPDSMMVPAQAVRIGDLGIVALPCEVFVEIGLELRRRSPLPHTYTVGLANSYNGYLPTAAHHALGGYETWRARSSYLEVEAADKLQKAALQLLGELAK